MLGNTIEPLSILLLLLVRREPEVVTKLMEAVGPSRNYPPKTRKNIKNTAMKKRKRRRKMTTTMMEMAKELKSHFR